MTWGESARSLSIVYELQSVLMNSILRSGALWRSVSKCTETGLSSSPSPETNIIFKRSRRLLEWFWFLSQSNPRPVRHLRIYQTRRAWFLLSGNTPQDHFLHRLPFSRITNLHVWQRKYLCFPGEGEGEGFFCRLRRIKQSKLLLIRTRK